MHLNIDEEGREISDWTEGAYHPRPAIAYGRPSTPEPTMAVTLWKAEYHHLAFREDVIGSQSSIFFTLVPFFFICSSSSDAIFLFLFLFQNLYSKLNQYCLSRRLTIISMRVIKWILTLSQTVWVVKRNPNIPFSSATITVYRFILCAA